MGRPTKQTAAMKERLLIALRAGNTRRAACRYAGISPDSLARYMRNAAFAAEIEAAEAACELRMVKVIIDAAEAGQYAPAQWWLERNPSAKQEWKKLEGHEHSGPDGGPIRLEHAAEAFDHRFAALAERAGQERPAGELEPGDEGGPLLPVGAVGENGADRA